MRRQRRGTVPLPPMPENPSICRWCSRTLQAYGDGERFCASGCAAPDNPLYSGRCTDCERDFDTGDKWATTFCWQCLARARQAQRADTGGAAGYLRDRYRVGANLRAMEIKHEQQASEIAAAERRGLERDEQAEIQRLLK